MSCYHPLKALDFGIHPKTGKHVIKIVKSDYDPKEKNDNCKVILLPCGNCIGCRLEYSRQWAIRMLCELEDTKKYGNGEACFLTLTYNNEHLPEKNYCYDSDGVEYISPYHPLNKRDIQLFIKRLRKRFQTKKIRYYLCGEYGSDDNTKRPHYHLVLFGIDFHEDRKLHHIKNGFMYYTSDEVKKLWTDPKDKNADTNSYGIHIITDVSFDTCAYVARYVTKKMRGEDADVYDLYGIPCEFSLMSRRPGIGRLYFDEHKEDIYEYDEIYMNGQKYRPP